MVTGSRKEKGYALLGVLILVTVSGLFAVGSLTLSQVAERTTLASEVRDREFFYAEDGLSRATTWMRTNSTSMVYPFDRKNFYTLFTRTAPSFGANDTSPVKVATRIKLRGTNNSAILANDTSLATSAFPLSVDTVSGANFNALTSFAAASMGKDKVRVTLVDAIAFDPTQDFGDPASGSAAPNTDFYPIYRIDSMRSLEQGSHVFGYVLGELVTTSGLAFYGKEFIEMRQSCDSYVSTAAAPNYAAANRRANCSVGSDKDIQVHQQEKVFGSAETKKNAGISNSSPYSSGGVCSDFASPCKPGRKCEGASCNVPALPTYKPWNEYCPQKKAAAAGVVADGSTTTPASNNPIDKCWTKLTLGNKVKTTLTSTTIDYFFEELDVANNVQTLLDFKPNPSSGTINIYVRKFTGDKFNGNQMINTTNRPTQLRIHYLGTDSLTINGNAAMNAFITAPYAHVTLQGNADFSGGIRALSITATGNADVHYDESGNAPVLSDVSYKTRMMNQYYR